MISKNIVVTKIVIFRSLLLILKEITFVFAIIINLFIWHVYSLPYYNIQFTIGRYASKIHRHICFEENDTKVCFYNYESCHKINTLGLFYHALVATVYEWLIQISICIMARISYLRWWCFVLSWILIFLIFCNVLQIIVCPFVPFLLIIVLSGLFRFTDSGYPFDFFKLFFVQNSVLYPQNKNPTNS